MKKLNHLQTLQELAKALKKPCIYVSWRGYMFDKDADFREVIKAAPMLDIGEDCQLLADDNGIIVCNSKKEMEDTYWRIVGDDGPTRFNKYDGPCHVYAITCGADGELKNENT